MLNRRTLRVKAMQALFAFEQCKTADFNVGLQVIEEAFSPDLNSMDVQDPELLKIQSKEATTLYKENANDDSDKEISKSAASDQKIVQVVNDTIRDYHKQVEEDNARVRKTMIVDAECIHDHYIKILNLLVHFGQLAEAGVGFKKSEDGLQRVFAENSILKALRENENLSAISLKKNLLWDDNSDNVRDWFRDIVTKDEEYKAYIALEKPDKSDDYEILNHIIRKIIFKQEAITSYWENLDINWIEDHAIVRSLINKTLKSFEENNGELELATLSYNWEDDREFFRKLYDDTVKNEKFLKKTISEKTKNWDFDRIAFTDRLILMMAICEMMNFPSIPIKVTINEYIEVSKNYSTPKSKQFVNGVLDVIAVDLQERGLIKKSGRGLIDNK